MYRRSSFALLLIGMIANLAAQTGPTELPGEIFREFQFNLSTPGARASGMGRAFVGLADDASAAISNPAGLALNLLRPQVYFEYKHAALRNRRLAERDALNTRELNTFRESVDAFSFFNFSHPLGDRVVVAFTRHEFINFEDEFVLGDRTLPGSNLPLFLPVRGARNEGARIDFKGVSYAGTFSLLVTDRFSLGLTISVDQIDALARTRSFAGDSICAQAGTPPSVLQRACVSSDFEVASVEIDDTDTDVGLTVGGLFQATENFAFGATFTKGADFDLMVNASGVGSVSNVTVVPFAAPRPDTGQDGLIIIDDGDFTNVTGSGTAPFSVPDRIGFGFSFRPDDRLLFLFDVSRINYSDNAENDVTFSPQVAFGVQVEQQVVRLGIPSTGNPDDYEIDDVTEIHFGGEVNVGKQSVPIFLRGGVFNNPDHRVRFVGSAAPPSGTPPTDPPCGETSSLACTVLANQAAFNTQDRRTGLGWTTGFGMNYKKVQADLAFVSIDSFDELVVSFAFRF